MHAMSEQQHTETVERDCMKWVEAFLDRAQRRAARSTLVTASEQTSDVVLPEDARLWEIRCKVRRSR